MSEWPWLSNCVAREERFSSAPAVLALNRLSCCSSALVDLAVAGSDVVHRRDEFGNARDERSLERVEVLVGAGEHFLQQDVAFTQPLEQGKRVGPQDLAGVLQLGDGGGCYQARLVDRRTRRLFEILQRLVDSPDCDFARSVDLAGQIRAAVHHCDSEGAALVLDGLQRGLGCVVDDGRDVFSLERQCIDQCAALAVDQLGELFGAGANAVGDRFDLAVQRRAEPVRGNDDGALDFRGSRLDLAGRGRRCGHDGVFRFAGCGQDAALQVAGDVLELCMHFAGDGLQLRADFAGDGLQLRADFARDAPQMRTDLAGHAL